jgi:hypothetical protein
VIETSTDGNNIISSIQKRIRTIPFDAVLAAGTNNTIIAGQISFRYRITEVEIVFQDNANNQLLVYVLVSKNSNISTTTVPPDYNIFSEFATTPYIVGEGMIKHIDVNHEVEDGEVYIKIYASNLNTYAQVVNVTVKIEEV